MERRDGCREEVLAAARRLHGRGHADFSPADVVHEMQALGTGYEETTIRTHVVSRMCADAPENHGTTYSDLERIGPGKYRMRDLQAAASEQSFFMTKPRKLDLL